MQHDAEWGSANSAPNPSRTSFVFFIAVRFGEHGVETHAEKLHMYTMTFRTLERLFIPR